MSEESGINRKNNDSSSTDDSAEKKPERRISVRALVEFILRNGDIHPGDGRVDPDAMQAGIRLHQKIQGRGGKNYKSEVSLKETYDLSVTKLTVEGRADGIIEGAHKDPGMTLAQEQWMADIEKTWPRIVTIDEIKTTYRDVYELEEPVPMHRYQAMAYACIYADQNDLERIIVQLTYGSLDDGRIRRFYYDYSRQELDRWFLDVLFSYSRFAEFEINHERSMRSSAVDLTFPYTFRPGQREMAAVVYKSLKEKKNSFVQAPTGVGKTLSTVYPAVRLLGEGCADRIFYLTAKTMTRTVAEDTFEILRSRGLDITIVTIYAKEKQCILDKPQCDPENCERARGHYDRVNECILEMLNHESRIDREIINEYAASYRVCPFELNLDLTLFADAVICDYNYLFDPDVHLKRFFPDSGPAGRYYFLVDEAHNLVDRARDMYSAVLDRAELMRVKKILAEDEAHRTETRYLNQILRSLLAAGKAVSQERDTEIFANADDIYQQCLLFTSAVEKDLQDGVPFDRDEVMDLYFEIRHFNMMYETLDKGYVIYGETGSRGASDMRLHLLCVDPSVRISRMLGYGQASLFFSATLLPVNYYKNLISGNTTDSAVYIDSPFDQKNRLILQTSGVTTKYTMRGRQMDEKIISYIRSGTVRSGNYMIFASSYRMLQDLYDTACDMGFEADYDMIIQENDMDEEERELFLSEFEGRDRREHSRLLAFCILGGIFSEGIDLTGEKLIGAFIVGNGLPQVGTERNILKEYFDGQGRDGFAYAYIYPGMNKVLQAAGRVIRTEHDRGVIFLMDDRFRQSQYSRLFPREWNDIRQVNLSDTKEVVESFWKEEDCPDNSGDD